jgi:hypothetical protein
MTLAGGINRARRQRDAHRPTQAANMNLIHTPDGPGAVHQPAPISAVILDMDGTLLDLHFDDQVWNHRLPALLAERHGRAAHWNGIAWTTGAMSSEFRCTRSRPDSHT